MSNPDLWDERKGWGVVWNVLTSHLDALRDMVQRVPEGETCVVLRHPILIPMAALAQSVRPDLHIVAAYLAPSNLCSSHGMLTAGSQRIAPWVPLFWRKTLWRLIHKLSIDPTTLPCLNASRAQHHLPKVPHFFEHMLNAPHSFVGIFPDWFASVQPDWPQPFLAGNFLPALMQPAA